MGYTKQVYDKAWGILEARRREAEAHTAENRRRALEAVPEIREIEREMARSSAGVTRAVIASPETAEEAIEKLAQQNLALQEQRAALLQQNGFAPDFLAEQHGCVRCRDKGYIGTEMCACLREILEQQAYLSLASTAAMQSCTFDNFQLDYYAGEPDASGISPRERMEGVYTFCRRYAEGFRPGADSLLLIGQTGLGKTHLSLSIAGEVTRMGYGVVYTPVQKLIDTLEADKFSYDSERKDQYAEHMRAAISCDLLVLDDLGTEFTTQFTTALVYNIVNSRQVDGKPTIINTNLELADIEHKYSQRMFSRLVCAYKVLKFTGKDIRFLRRSSAHETR